MWPWKQQKGAFLLPGSKYLWSIATKAEGCFFGKVPKRTCAASVMALWPAVWIRDGLTWTHWSIGPLLWTTGHLFMPRGKITGQGIARLSPAWLANNHPWDVQFRPVLKEKNDLGLSIQWPQFLCIPPSAWEASPRFFVLSLAPAVGELAHLISLCGAQGASFRPWFSQMATAKLK